MRVQNSKKKWKTEDIATKIKVTIYEIVNTLNENYFDLWFHQNELFGVYETTDANDLINAKLISTEKGIVESDGKVKIIKIATSKILKFDEKTFFHTILGFVGTENLVRHTYVLNQLV